MFTEDNLLLVRTFESSFIDGQDFTLYLYDLGYDFDQQRHKLGYRFYDDNELIFSSSDFYPSPSYALDIDNTIAALLSFLSLQEGDTDSEYFKHYTEKQINWRDSMRCEDLSIIAYELEEGLY